MSRQRKQIKADTTDITEASIDALAKTIRDIPGDKLRAILKRDKAFTFRLSEVDRGTMEKAAKAMGVSVAEYLIRLHYAAYDSLKEAGIVV